MRYAQLIFSPVGGTQTVADIISGEWGVPVETVDLTDPAADFAKTAFQRGDLVLIAVPSYGGRVPGLAAQRLARIQGGGASCVLVCVYGNRAYEDTLVELQDLADQCGFQVLAAVAGIAEHSIIHQYAANRPDGQDAEQLRTFSREILNKFHSKAPAGPGIQVPGRRPYKKTGGASLVPKAGASCTGCGLCAERCPAQAIRRQTPQDTDPKTCISCMRCVVHCPHSARSVSRVLVSAAALALKKECSVRKPCELFL